MRLKKPVPDLYGTFLCIHSYKGLIRNIGVFLIIKLPGSYKHVVPSLVPSSYKQVITTPSEVGMLNLIT